MCPPDPVSSSSTAPAHRLQFPKLRRWALPCLVGVSAFGYRLLSLHDFADDHYMQLAWAQQLLLGELPGRDFIDPGLPLTYALSAAAQALSPGPLSEAYLTIALLAIAAVVTCVAVTRACGSTAAGILSAGIVVAIGPQLYNYHKILVPAVALLLVESYARRPNTTRSLMLATWTTLATLLRYDLGLYTGAAILASVTLVAIRRKPAEWRVARAAGTYIALTVATILPYVLFLALTVGVGEDIHGGLEFSRAEAHQLRTMVPSFEFLSCTFHGNECLWGRSDSVAYLYYLNRALIVGAIALLIARRRTLARETQSVALAGVVLAVAYSAVILRHPIDRRILDVATPFAVLLVWTTWESARWATAAGRTARLVASGMGALALVLTLESVLVLGNVREHLGDIHAFEGVARLEARLRDIRTGAEAWPWEKFWPVGPLPQVVRYVHACTTPTDRLLTTWFAPDYYFFTRRGFAAGHAMFLAHGSFSNARDQALMMERIRRQSVPLILFNRTSADEFAHDYPVVNRYLDASYRTIGTFASSGSVIEIRVRSDLRATSTFGDDHWPCGFQPGLPQRADARDVGSPVEALP